MFTLQEMYTDIHDSKAAWLQVRHLRKGLAMLSGSQEDTPPLHLKAIANLVFVLFCFLFYLRHGLNYVAQAAPELAVILPQPPKITAEVCTTTPGCCVGVCVCVCVCVLRFLKAI
jgi:hypothetical protein